MSLLTSTAAPMMKLVPPFCLSRMAILSKCGSVCRGRAKPYLRPRRVLPATPRSVMKPPPLSATFVMTHTTSAAHPYKPFPPLTGSALRVCATSKPAGYRKPLKTCYSSLTCLEPPRRLTYSMLTMQLHVPSACITTCYNTSLATAGSTTPHLLSVYSY